MLATDKSLIFVEEGKAKVGTPGCYINAQQEKSDHIQGANSFSLLP